MDKLWGGRFNSQTDSNALSFHSSVSFDSKMYKQDILGSIAHAKMLSLKNIIPKQSAQNIIEGLKHILEDIEDNKIEFSVEDEDIHMNIEKILTLRIGEDAKKLHTARSRNDQVATDIRLYLREATDNITDKIKNLIYSLTDIASNNLETYMSAYTHLQKAQPTTLAHYIMAYAEMFLRDMQRFSDSRKRINICPLGSGALCGTTYPIDREFTSLELGFDAASANSLDSVSDRDFIIEFISNASICMMHLSRFCEEIIIWSSNEFATVILPDEYSTGSSIMPQKKNPDMAELIRGKTGRVYGDLMTILTVMKGLPLAYNKDMQEDKECVFDAYETLSACLSVFTGMIVSLVFDVVRLELSAYSGFINATDLADYLVKKGMSFREAHAVSGKAVKYCEQNKLTLNKLSLEIYKTFSELIEDDIYDEISLKNCVNNRNNIGFPAPQAVKQHISAIRDALVAKNI